MSRIGRRPISIVDGVKISCEKKKLSVNGSKGNLSFVLSDLVEIEIQDNVLFVKADYQNSQKAKSLMGTTQSIIQNMILGVSQGFSKKLNLVGVGYKAVSSGRKLELHLGYSHPITFSLPEGVNASVSSNTQLTLESSDKYLLGQVAAEIRAFRPPEPYKGKGVLFENENLRRKAGKTGKK